MKNIKLALAIILTILFGHLTAQNTVTQHETGSCVDQTDLTILNVEEIIQIFDPPVKEIRGNYTPLSDMDPEVFKNVFFVHGLGGHSASWAPATRHVATTYKALTPEINYRQEVTIPQAATWLNLDFGEANNSLEEDYPDSKGEESIFIGHSMGGIVGRQMDYDVVNNNFKKRFNAMATFGSPHQGAKIIETLQNGEVEEYFKRGCEVLSDAGISKIEADLDLQLKGIMGMLFNKRIMNLEKTMFGYLEDYAKNYLCDKLVEIGFQSMAADIAPPIGAALNPNSELISTLGSHKIHIDNVAFYGIEKGTYEEAEGEGVDGYAALRQLHSLNKMSTATDFGGENEDVSYISDYINLKNFLLSQSSYYSGPPSYNYTLVIWPWSNPLDPDHENNAECISLGGTPVTISLVPPIPPLPPIFPTNPTFLSSVWMMRCDLPGDAATSSSYSKAYQFVSDFDKEYRILFGHLEVEYQTVGQRPVCKCYHVNGDLVDIEDVPCFDSEIYQNLMYNSNIQCRDEFEPVYDYVESNIPGDCVVIQSSASNFPGVNHYIRLNDNNHQQMRNSKEAKNEFENLFDGNKYGEDFYLNRK